MVILEGSFRFQALPNRFEPATLGSTEELFVEGVGVSDKELAPCRCSAPIFLSMSLQGAYTLGTLEGSCEN